MSDETADQILSLNEGMERLREIDKRAWLVVELHFIAGLKWHQVAELIEVSPVTVRRDWVWARAWLRKEIGTDLGFGTSEDDSA